LRDLNVPPKYQGGISLPSKDCHPKVSSRQTSILFNVRVNQAWKATRVKPVAIWLVLFLGTRIVDHESLGSRRSANHDTVQCISLVLGLSDGTVLVMVKEAQGEERNPSVLVMTNTMNK
jgi:hypothetical protein